MLTPDEAAPIVGVPAAQLKRWAWDRVGPKNSGTRHKPKYREEDLRAWKAKRWELYRERYHVRFTEEKA
jgi:hypothetical protein